MRARIALLAAAVVLVGACGTRATPTPTPTASSAAVERVQIYYARNHEAPLAIGVDVDAGLSIERRVVARFAALAAAPWLGPGVSFNVLRDAARVQTVSVDRDLAVIDFAVVEDEWGLPDHTSLRAFLEQVVFTATDEKSIYEVRLTQNGGQDAVIGTRSAIVTFSTPLTRELVLR